MNTKLKIAMVRKGVKNFDLAKYLGCDPAKVSRIVNGWLTPDRETKKRIAKYLRTAEVDLFESGAPNERLG